MTLILATGDQHWCMGPRWAECIRIHDFIAEQVETLRPDLVLLAGDLFERRSTAEERAMVAAWITRVAEVAPIIGVRGNHDERLSVELFSKLRTRHPVVMEERAGVHLVAGVAVAAFAWPSRAMLAAVLGEQATPETVAQAGREALRSVFRGLGEELGRHDGPRVLLGHAHLVGARVGLAGQPLAPGAEVTVGLEDLALAGADAVVLGHIHRADEWDFGGVPIAYTGSPFRNSFGEAEQKSILAIEIDQSTCGCEAGMPRNRCPLPQCRNRGVVMTERIATPATPMVLIEGEYITDASALDGQAPCLVWDWMQPGPELDVKGAEVRMRYLVASDAREAARGAAMRERDRLLAAGALSVKAEEVVSASTRARAPEVAEERTTWGQLEAHWRSKPDAPVSERMEGLRSKLGLIEEAVSQ